MANTMGNENLNRLISMCRMYQTDNIDKVERFFDALTVELRLYSPSLGIAVMLNDWYAGDDLVSQELNLAYASPGMLEEHISFYDSFDLWTTNMLADFHSWSYDINNHDEIESAIPIFAAISVVDDWTSDPVKGLFGYEED